jgi:hypothetical protein
MRPFSSLRGGEKASRRWGGRCRFPNGVWTVVVALVLLFAANCLSLVGLLGCRIVTVEADLEAIFANATAVTRNDTLVLVWTNTNTTVGRRGLGLLGWEGSNGKCIRKDDVEFRDLYAGYRHVTGFAWKDARVQAIGTVAISWPAFLWLLSFTCYAYSTLVRNILGLVIVVILPCAQSLQLTLKESDFCDTHICNWGRSLWLYVIHGCYAILGYIWCCFDSVQQ